MSTKEHCHGCGKLWSEESPDCVFNYHKKPESKCIIQNCKLCGNQIIQLWIKHPITPDATKRVLCCLNCDLITGIIKKGDYDSNN